MDKILGNAWLQGGAILFLIVLLIIAIVMTFKYIVKPLWDDNKALRERNFVMNERVATMGEAMRSTSENNARAMAQLTESFQSLMALQRIGKP